MIWQAGHSEREPVCTRGLEQRWPGELFALQTTNEDGSVAASPEISSIQLGNSYSRCMKLVGRLRVKAGHNIQEVVGDWQVITF